MKKYIYILGLFVIGISSCKKDEVIGGTAVQDMSGEWFLQENGEGGYIKIVTYNTSDDSSTQMWFDDEGTLWDVKGKVNVDVNNKTFSGTDIENQIYESKFTVTNGKIIKGGAKGPVSNSVTDAISFDISFDDDDEPGKVYHFVGYHRTKFPGDDH
jgi:hypothetical protein